MLIVGERINSSRRRVAQAIEIRDAAFIQNEATIQAEAGAHHIDVNAGAFAGDESDCLRWLVETVQKSTELPLSIDSPDPEVIKEVIPLVDKPPMINSVTLEPNRLRGILPLVATHQARLIGLCQSEDKMAETVDDKVRLAGQLVEIVTRAGIPLNDLYIDPLVYPLATHPRAATASVEAIERIMREFKGVHTICGLTNISYGLPERKLINRTFLVAAMTRGLDAVILDPTDASLFAALKAGMAVAGRDDYCMDYIAAFRAGRLA